VGLGRDALQQRLEGQVIFFFFFSFFESCLSLPRQQTFFFLSYCLLAASLTRARRARRTQCALSMRAAP
jgi:hypothetical protein